MPEQSRGRRFWGHVGDAFIPGNAYTSQGGWDRGAVITGLSGIGGSIVAGPLGQSIAMGIANRAQGRHVLEGQYGFHSRQPAVPRNTFAPQGGLSAMMGYQPGNYTRAPMGQPNYANPNAGVLPNATIQQTQVPFQQYSPQMYPALRSFNTGGHQAPSTMGVRDRGQGFTGEAARGLFEGMSDASRFNTNFDFSGMTRNS